MMRIYRWMHTDFHPGHIAAFMLFVMFCMVFYAHPYATLNTIFYVAIFVFICWCIERNKKKK